MKKHKKSIIISSIIIFILSTLIHSFYEMLPNCITLIFCPVNESIWEHMKMIFTSYTLFILIKYLFFSEKTILIDTITSYLNIIIFLIIYLPIHYLFKENIFVTLTLYFISIIISQCLRIILTKKIHVNNKQDNLSIIIIIITYIIFTYLTYYPFNIDLFTDPINNKRGLYKIR